MAPILQATLRFKVYFQSFHPSRPLKPVSGAGFCETGHFPLVPTSSCYKAASRDSSGPRALSGTQSPCDTVPLRKYPHAFLHQKHGTGVCPVTTKANTTPRNLWESFPLGASVCSVAEEPAKQLGRLSHKLLVSKNDNTSKLTKLGAFKAGHNQRGKLIVLEKINLLLPRFSVSSTIQRVLRTREDSERTRVARTLG